MKNDGGPAFPRDGRENPCIVSPQTGMSLRDWFAGMAMQAYCSDKAWRIDMDNTHTASSAYRMADSMLAERAK